jgi:hypothetical protein
MKDSINTNIIFFDGNRLGEQTEAWYPEVSAAVRIITQARIQGREMNKRRPNTLLKIVIGEWVVEIKPTVSSSPTGWVTDGAATIKLISLHGKGRGVVCKLRSDGRLRMSRWWRKVDRSIAELSVIHEAMDRIAADPGVAISQRHTHCGLCGKGFTREDSMYRGIGPECWKYWDRIKEEIIKPEFTDISQDGMVLLRKDMQKYHPDKPDGDAEKFMATKARFDVLRKQRELLS